jgi:hypothetical protein
MFLCLAVAYSLRVDLSVAIVAMMDRNGTGVDFPVSIRILGNALFPKLDLQFWLGGGGGSTPDEVIDIFSIDLILPAGVWPWELTQPLTEMSTRKSLFWVGALLAHTAVNLIAVYEPNCLENVGSSMSGNPIGLHSLLQ